MKLTVFKLTFLTSLLTAACVGAEFEETILFSSGEEGYSNYRIPSLLETADGTLLAFCEARKDHRGDSGNIDLVVKRSRDGGHSWSGLKVVWDAGDDTAGNPCPVVDRRTGRIHLFMCWNLGSDHGRDLHAGKAMDTRRVFVARSDDEGASWSEPEEITRTVKDPSWWWYATGPGIGIQLSKGDYKNRLVIPANHTADGYYGAHTLYSDDGGFSWNVSSVIKPTVNESQLVELSDGRLMMNMRSQGLEGSLRPRNGYRSVSFSEDGGETWSDPVFDSHLGDPVCQASLIRYDDRRILFSNPSPPIRAERGKRIQMTIRMSEDDGRTWPYEFQVYEGASAYSSLARLSDGKVGLLYEKEKDIAFCRIPIELIR